MTDATTTLHTYAEFEREYADANQRLQEIQSSVYSVIELGHGYTLLSYYSVTDNRMKTTLLTSGDDPTFGQEYHGSLSDVPVVVLERYATLVRLVNRWQDNRDIDFPNLQQALASLSSYQSSESVFAF
jgi:hypothetical protein